MTRYRFQDCLIDTDRHELRVCGLTVEVQPLIFDLLCYLARHAGRTVTKDELLSAVWRSSFVTDSVLARAVMKARRAIKDNADSPQFIITVRGHGYRLDAAVETELSPPLAGSRPLQPPQAVGAAQPAARATEPKLDLAVLPFFNETSDPGLSWVELGLPSLVHHQLQMRSELRLVRSEAVDAWTRRSVWSEQDAALACRQLNCRLALVGRVSRRGDGMLSLHFLLGSEAELELSRSFDGLDLLTLAQKLVREVESACGGTPSPQEESFWDEQSARILDLAARGESERALALLESSLPRIRPDLRLRLVQACLLRDLARMQESVEVAQAALAEAGLGGQADLQAELLAELGRSAVISGQMDEAERYNDQALELVLQGKASITTLPNVLVGRGEQFRFKGQGEEAAKAAERAISAAQATGDVYWELIARCLQAHALMATQQLARAREQLRGVAREARSRDLLRVELQAYVSLGAIETGSRHYGAALESLSRAATLARTLGSRVRYITSQLQSMFALIESGRLSEAAQLVARFADEVGEEMPQNSRESLERAKAHLLWRTGEQLAAITQLEAMLDIARCSRWFSRWNSASLLCNWYLVRGEVGKAASLLEVLDDDSNPARRARCQAAVMLKQGLRTQALATLRTVWLTESSEGAPGQDLAVDLGWLLMEEGLDTELDVLMSRVSAMSAEHGPTALLQLVFAARKQGQPPDPSWRNSLDELVARLPALQRHTPDLLAYLRSGELFSRAPPRMELLLNAACD